MIKIYAIYSGIYQTFIRQEIIILFLAEKSLCSDLILTIPVAIKWRDFFLKPENTPSGRGGKR